MLPALPSKLTVAMLPIPLTLATATLFAVLATPAKFAKFALLAIKLPTCKLPVTTKLPIVAVLVTLRFASAPMFVMFG